MTHGLTGGRPATPPVLPSVALLLVALLLVALGAAACESDPRPTPEDAPRASGAGGAATVLEAGEATAQIHRFDPATLQPGDTVLGLTAEAVELTRVLEDSVWVGSVVFAGDLVLHGIYQRHPDWPQVALPCVHVVQPASVARIPRFPPDPYGVSDPRIWFCFANAEVALELISPDPPREVVIAVDRYWVVRELTDAYDLAQLAELLEVGPAAVATLAGR